jgi:hypothetical protein
MRKAALTSVVPWNAIWWHGRQMRAHLTKGVSCRDAKMSAFFGLRASHLAGRRNCAAMLLRWIAARRVVRVRFVGRRKFGNFDQKNLFQRDFT